MVIFAKQKKIPKKTVFYKKENKAAKKVKQAVSWWYFWLLILVLFSVFWVYTVLQYTLYAPENYIYSVTYNPMSVKEYNNPYLYKEITTLLTGNNYYLFKSFNEDSITESIKTNFPIVSDIEYTNIGPNSVSVFVDFYDPDILIWLQQKKYWVFWNNIFPLYSWNTIWTWVFTVELPNYLSGVESINWLFFDIGANKFIEDSYQIKKSFPQADRIVYLPWPMVTVVFVYDKMVYIHHDWDISQQISNFYLIEKYHSWIDNIKTIDLWSLELDKAIARDF